MEDKHLDEIIQRFEDALENQTSVYLDADEWVELVGYYIDALDEEYAEKALMMGKEQYPFAIDLSIKELELYLHQEKLEEAAFKIRELKDLKVHDLDFALSEAKYWSLRGFSDRAVMLYEQALDFQEDEAFIHNCIADEFMMNQKYAQALHHYQKALEYDPEDAYAFVSALDCYSFLHKDQECLQFVENHIDINPYNELAWHALGEIKMSENRFSEAVHAFDYAVLIQSEFTQAHLQKAACLEQLNRFEEAIASYQDILLYHQNIDLRAFVLNQIAKNYIQLNDFNQAHQALIQSIELDASQAVTYYLLSKVYAEKQLIEKALFFVFQALKLEQDNEVFLRQAVQLLISLERYEEALEQQKKLFYLNPQVEEYWESYLVLLITLGETSDALHVIHDLEKSFQDARLCYLKAACLAHQKYFLQAVECLNQATTEKPHLLKTYIKILPILEKLLHIHKN